RNDDPPSAQGTGLRLAATLINCTIQQNLRDVVHLGTGRRPRGPTATPKHPPPLTFAQKVLSALAAPSVTDYAPLFGRSEGRSLSRKAQPMQTEPSARRSKVADVSELLSGRVVAFRFQDEQHPSDSAGSYSLSGWRQDVAQFLEHSADRRFVRGPKDNLTLAGQLAEAAEPTIVNQQM